MGVFEIPVIKVRISNTLSISLLITYWETYLTTVFKYWKVRISIAILFQYHSEFSECESSGVAFGNYFTESQFETGMESK